MHGSFVSSRMYWISLSIHSSALPRAGTGEGSMPCGSVFSRKTSTRNPTGGSNAPAVKTSISKGILLMVNALTTAQNQCWWKRRTSSFVCQHTRKDWNLGKRRIYFPGWIKTRRRPTGFLRKITFRSGAIPKLSGSFYPNSSRCVLPPCPLRR